MKPSDCTVMVIDNGLFVELADTLGRSFKKVYYHRPWQDSFPKRNNASIGQGFPHIEAVLDPWTHYDETDLWVFPDIGHGPLQRHLAAQGKLVWGARMGEKMEQDRESLKKTMTEKGLPVGPYEVVKGLTALREHLKAHRKQYVKIDVWRGYMESFRAESYMLVKPLLDELQHTMGEFAESMTFICEEELPDKIELGVDAYNINGQMPDRALIGIEVKDLGYAGCVMGYDKIPEPLTRFDRVMVPEFRKTQYRGFYSTEVRIGKDLEPYMIDLCSRAGSPPSELYQELYLNLADIVLQGAQGTVVNPKCASRYGVEVILKCPAAMESWVPIYIPEANRQYVKLHNAAKINGRWYVIPQTVGMAEIGGCIGWGNTLDAAMDAALEVADTVKAYNLEIPAPALDKAQEQIEKAQSFGLNIF